MELNSSETLLLTRADLQHLLKPADYLDVAETAFKAHAEGRVFAPALMHVDVDEGEFHIKAGGLKLKHNYFALKSNGGFFGNADRYQLPPIQGVILLCNADNGSPLALMDSTAITLGRTGATTALAARLLAREDAHTVTICGCGNQGAENLRYLTMVREITTAYAWDAREAKACAFAEQMSNELGIEVIPQRDLATAMRATDICVTCTPSHQPFIEQQYLREGMFIAAVGADSPDKQELFPEVAAKSKLVVDLKEQCAAVGELHHSIAAGLMSLGDVHAELGEVLVGAKPGRESDDEVIVFDATGTALQDAAAAAAAYERSAVGDFGSYFDFFSRKHT